MHPAHVFPIDVRPNASLSERRADVHLSDLLRLRIYVQIASVYVGLAFVGCLLWEMLMQGTDGIQVLMEVLWFGVWCRPFSQYWAVPASESPVRHNWIADTESSSAQCSSGTNHLITNAVLNISSDMMIMAIPLPLVLAVKIPLKNKMVLGGLLFIGLFTVSRRHPHYICARLWLAHPRLLQRANWFLRYLRLRGTSTNLSNIPSRSPG